ncbi:type III secretion system chaperone [Aureimonas sp. AU4]|uniref:type III secretion system chaperone n=1 Tax=Aureimonas sp. AU4 TaxID=1638163 RepID=UPI000781E093|nr:type III secretion system chaperone [Aureimonas sp. AU4]
MQDINHALSVIADKLSLANLSLNTNGQAEIVFGDGLSIYVTRVEPAVAELSFRLPHLDFADPPMMRAMLEANCLGAGTGPGRLGVDADRGECIYSERWEISDLSAARVEAKLASLIQYGVFWRTKGTDLLLSEAEKHRQSDEGDAPLVEQHDEQPMILRV